MADGSGSRRPRQAVAGAAAVATGAGYVLLFAFGLLQGLTGSMQFSRSVGPVPLTAIGFAVVIGCTCALSGRGMGSAWGAISPAAGWVLASFAMAMPAESGTVVITNTAAGQVYLYGGALAAAVGVGTALSGWHRRRLPDVSGRERSAGQRRGRPERSA